MLLLDWHQVQEEYRLHLDLAILQCPLYCERDGKIEIVRDRVSCSKMGYFKDANSHVLKAFILRYFHSVFFGETLLFLCASTETFHNKSKIVTLPLLAACYRS